MKFIEVVENTASPGRQFGFFATLKAGI